jgi:hypothetical protein
MTMPPNRTEVLHGEESLLPELIRYLDSNPEDHELVDIYHPLLFVFQINPYKAAWVNAQYRKTKARVDAALAARDVDTYVLSHERPYRFEALKRCVKKSLLTENDYWPMVAWVWIDSNNIFQNLAGWKRLWSEKIPNREMVMNENERSCLATMPNLIRVWRGMKFKKSVTGLAWTFNAEKAEWFANRELLRGSKKSFVASGLVAKGDVYAVFLRRHEFEVVTERVNVETLREVCPQEDSGLGSKSAF